jgi:hypothetical protein
MLRMRRLCAFCLRCSCASMLLQWVQADVWRPIFFDVPNSGFHGISSLTLLVHSSCLKLSKLNIVVNLACAQLHCPLSGVFRAWHQRSFLNLPWTHSVSHQRARMLTLTRARSIMYVCTPTHVRTTPPTLSTHTFTFKAQWNSHPNDQSAPSPNTRGIRSNNFSRRDES